MLRVGAILPQVSAYPCARPSQCPCGGGILHSHGEVQKRVKNIYETEIIVMRYRCVGCGRAFTRYPEALTEMDAASG